ncbi:MAG TPA: glycosyl hydrolase [Chloroflexota bacterium]|nr:glycosyl hydrolase [Chloroflexota bacterium]
MTACLSPNGLNVYRESEPVRRLLVGTLNGLAVLERQAPGGGWKVSGRVLDGVHVSSLMIEPLRGGIFGGSHVTRDSTSPGGLYRSLDGGQTWERRTNGITTDHVFCLRSVQENGQPVIYAGTEPAGLFRSEDYGDTWEDRPALRTVPNTDKWMFPSPPHVAHVKTMAFDPRDPKIIYAGVEQGALLKTTDGGQTWRELESFSRPEDRSYKDIHQITIRPSNPDELYMTTGPGLYHSTDGGETWEHLTDSAGGFRVGYPDHLHYAPDDDRVMFMSGASEDPGTWRQSHHADATVMRSDDGGRTWRQAGKGLPQSMRANIEAMGRASWPGGFALFAGTTDGAVFCSEDGAESWTEIASGLPPVSKSRHYMNLQVAAA